MKNLTINKKVSDRISVLDLVTFINTVHNNYGIEKDVKNINAYDYTIIDDIGTSTMTTIKIKFEIFYGNTNEEAVRKLEYICYRGIDYSCANISTRKIV